MANKSLKSMNYNDAERFKHFLKQQPYRNILNWQWIEKEAGLASGRIANVVDSKESFTEAENTKLYLFFSEMARDCLSIPFYVTS